MGQHDSKTKGVDYLVTAALVDDFREMINALVAGLVVDGFTDREAHALVAGFWAANVKQTETGEQP